MTEPSKYCRRPQGGCLGFVAAFLAGGEWTYHVLTYDLSTSQVLSAPLHFLHLSLCVWTNAQVLNIIHFSRVDFMLDWNDSGFLYEISVMCDSIYEKIYVFYKEHCHRRCISNVHSCGGGRRGMQSFH